MSDAQLYAVWLYDLIQGPGHEPFKVGNQAVFKSYLLRHLHCELATGDGFLN